MFNQCRIRNPSIGFTLQEPTSDRQVLGTYHEETESFGAIAPRATYFLVIGFDGTWWSNMNHGSDIRSIDTHTKRTGCRDDIDVPLTKGLRYPLSLIRAETSVVSPRTPPCSTEFLGFVFSTLTGRGVDNRGALRPYRIAQCSL